MLKRFLKPIKLPGSVDWAVLILRVGISCLMLTHGYAKLTGFLSGDHSFADPIGIGEELLKNKCLPDVREGICF